MSFPPVSFPVIKCSTNATEMEVGGLKFAIQMNKCNGSSSFG